MKRRLYLQLYAAFVAMGVVAVLGVGLTVRWVIERERPAPMHLMRCAAALAAALPTTDSPGLQPALERYAEALRARLVLWSPSGERVAQAEGVPEGRRGHKGPHGSGPIDITLDDGRRIAIDMGPPGGPPRGPVGFGALLVAFLLVFGAGAFPLARRITRRIEALERAATQLGEGKLGARVPVEGSDEVAGLAARFNWAAERLEAHVHQQKLALAHTSHELRSPLARLRLAVEMLGDAALAPAHHKLAREAIGDIDELNGLIGDVLLSARLDAGDVVSPPPSAPVRWDALVRDQLTQADLAARAQWQTPTPEPCWILGDAAMLGRLLRNLVDNASKYAPKTAAEVNMQVRRNLASLEVADRGPGLPASEAERVFQPFYRPAGHSEGEHGGVGLGLSLVRQIAHHHGGEVGWRPREGGGSVFWVSIPLYTPPSPRG